MHPAPPVRRVIHTAQALVDAVVEIPHLPSRGGNVMAGSYQRYAGGAVTILLAAARCGAHAVHAGSVGTGPNGDLIRATLTADAVQEVKDTGGKVALAPMNPFERKIVHDAVAAVPGVRSESEGLEPERRVVVLPDAT